MNDVIAHPLHTNFDKNLPLYVEALYKALIAAYDKANRLRINGHDCNCEFCEEDADGDVPEPSLPLYNEIRDEAIEISDTIRRCIRWASAKDIKLKRRASDYYLNMHIPDEA